MEPILIEASELDNLKGPALLEDRITQIISDCDIDFYDYFLAVAAAYGGLGDYSEALEQIHENEDWLAVNTKLYEHVYDTLTEGDPIEETQTEYMSEAFEDALESMITPMHYPL